MDKAISKRNLIIGSVAFALIFILLVVFVDWRTVFERGQGLNPASLGTAVLMLVSGYILFAIRWHVLLVGNPRFRSSFHASNAGNLINLLLPLRPGDAARILMMAVTENISSINVTTSVIIEKWYEQIMRIAALGGAIVFGVGLEVSTLTISGSLVYLGLAFWVLILLMRHQIWVRLHAPAYLAKIPKVKPEKAEEWTATLLEGLSRLVRLRSQIWVFIWSVGCWAAFAGFHYFTLTAIFPEIPTGQALGITFGSLALVPPSATTFPGFFQASLIIPLVLAGFDRQLLETYAIILNIIEIFVVVFMGIWGVIMIGIPIRHLLKVSVSAEEKSENSETDIAAGT
jgi:hypothetical protein